MFYFCVFHVQGLKQYFSPAKAMQWVFFEKPGWTVGQIADRFEPLELHHELNKIAYLCTSGAWRLVLLLPTLPTWDVVAGRTFCSTEHI